MAGSGTQPQIGVEEVVKYDASVGDGGGGFLDIGGVLRCGGAGGYSICIGDMGYVPTRWKGTGRFPPQVGLQTDREETK